MKAYALVDSCTQLASRKPLNATQATTAPVCADDDCMQCAMGLHCPNVPKATAKPRVRVCLSWSARQLEVAMFEAVLQANAAASHARMGAYKAAVSNFSAHAVNLRNQAILEAMRGPQVVHTPKPIGTSKSTLARAARHARNCAAMVRS